MNTLQDFDAISRGSTLTIGDTYFYNKRSYSGPAYELKEEWVPVTILGRARSGTYGGRVKCSDGVDRYQYGDSIGRNRSDTFKVNDLKYKLKAGKTFIKPRIEVPHVQLDLFDFVA